MMSSPGRGPLPSPETLPEKACLLTQGILLAGLAVLWFLFWVCVPNMIKHQKKKFEALT